MTKPSILPRYLRSLAPLALAVAAVCSMPAGATVLGGPPFTDHIWTEGYFTDLADLWSSGGVILAEPMRNPMPASQTLLITTGRAKYLNAHFTSEGAITAVDDLYFQNGRALYNQGTFDLKADVGFYDGGYGGIFSNTGVLRKSGGTGASTVYGVSFVNEGGLIDVQTGALNFQSGSVAFYDGTRFTGAGQTVVSAGAYFAGAISSENLVLSNGGHRGDNATLSGTVIWNGSSSLQGDWALSAGSTLAVQGGGTKYLNAYLTNNGRINSAETLYLQSGRVLTNNGTYDLQADVGFADGGYGGSFVNTGTLRKSAGTGVSDIGGIAYSGTGHLDVQSGGINFYSGSAVFDQGSTIHTAAGTSLTFSGGYVAFDGTQFTGTGPITVATSAGVSGVINAHQLNFASGSHTGGGGAAGPAAILQTDAAQWSGGTWRGSWVVDAGHQLDVTGGQTKYMSATLTNLGVIKSTDDLYFQSGNVVYNQGTFDLRADVGFYDGGYGGAFSNTGVLRKSGGSGTSAVNSISFVNQGGLIDVQTGVLNFQSGSVAFYDGTRFTGSGQTVVSTGAYFAGAIASENLVLSNGGHRGDGATLSGSVIWNGASTLHGDWTLSAGSTLAMQGGGTKYLNANLTNNGLITSAETLYLQSGRVLTNNGTYDLQADVGFADGGYGGTFINHGTLRKSGGTGVSVVSGVGFVNDGLIDVRVGQLQLPGTLSNVGEIKGHGTVVAATVLNEGHVAPGESPGTLTISGNYVQSALGALDIELDSATSFDKLVVTGSASLHGALNLICFGGCQLALGDTFTVLDAADGALSGTFASLSLSNLRDAEFTVVYDYDHGDVLVKVTHGNVTAVPEPEGWALALAGLSVAALLSRRRKGAPA